MNKREVEITDAQKLDSKLQYEILKKSPNSKIYLLSKEILSEKVAPPKIFEKNIFKIKQGNEIKRKELLQFLSDNGFEFTDSAVQHGFFAKRGGIVEVFPKNLKWPIRIEFMGNKITLISYFDPKTKKHGTKLQNTEIIPNKAIMGNSDIFDFFKKNKEAIIITDESFLLKEPKNQQIIFKNFEKGNINLDLLPPHLYFGNIKFFKKELDEFKKNKYEIKIFSKNKSKKFRTINIKMPENVSLGFVDAVSKKVFLSDYEIFGEKEQKEKARKKTNLDFITSIRPSDYVVHIDHGIGKFIGMQKNVIDEGKREYFVVEYAEKDKLYVPVEYADKLSRYIGCANPPIHRLHGALWNQVKYRIKEKTREIAGELLKLYAKREMATRHTYKADTEEQIELERSFKYEDTPDQRKVTEEIKQDMEKEKSMDRLLVGDVGFGKTEISVRTAHKATQNGKQVAMLCPTTILAEQHYNTYKKRLNNFDLKIEVLSRFKTKSEQNKIIKGLKSGDVDIVIGTHRLLSKDVSFKNLGLIIVDEEQRFGVEHKEMLKKLRNNVDVLSMTATPIPRTLHFSLVGIRDISTIKTPPPGRQPIDTHIIEYNERKLVGAIQNEINQSGQVYLLHNRVETIDIFTKRMRELLPKVKFETAHGQMPEKKLAKVMHDFYLKRFDVLVCSTIIESGLDIENVNTLIVDESTRFGLSQLYQLRGRIGRGHRKAHAHFFYKGRKLKGKAKERLQALLAANELGAGFDIAMRDLEIRGAGNMLGREQHGNINAIGLSLYSRLLYQAVEELKTGKIAEPQLDVTIDLPIDAFIPKDFFATEAKRLRAYQELASVQDQEQSESIVGNMILDSRFCHNKKELPKPVRNLIGITKLRLLAQKARILSIDTKIKKKTDGTRKQVLSLSFAGELSDKKFYKLIQQNPKWQKRENTAKCELDKFNMEKLIHTLANLCE